MLAPSTSYCYRTRIRGNVCFTMLFHPMSFGTCLFKVFHFQLHGVVDLRTPLLFCNKVEIIELYMYIYIYMYIKLLCLNMCYISYYIYIYTCNIFHLL